MGFLVKQHGLHIIAKATRMDKVDDTLAYVGKAPPGSTSSDAVWQIQKIVTTDEDIAITWADEGAFSQIWDDRASLTYT